MNQVTIKVELLETDKDTDVLRFFVSEPPIDVNLNSSECQASLKSVFSILLERIVSEDIKLELEINPSFTRQLYKDVCPEYINDINRELNEVKEKIRNQLNK